MKKYLILFMLMFLMLTGCSKYNNSRGIGDSPVGKQDRSPAEIIVFPDGFENVATKCDGHGRRIYTTTREAAPVVVIDSNCPGGNQ